MRLGTLRSNDGYIYKIFVRNSDVLHGSFVQFGIMMYFIGFTVSEYPCDDSLSIHETIFGVENKRFGLG